MRTVTYWSTLFRLAHAVGQARLAGDEVALAKAVEKHQAYEALCLASDEMRLDGLEV